MGSLSRQNKNWYTKAVVIRIQRVFVLKYYTRWGWSLKMRKIDINHQLIVIIPMVSCAKVLLSESITIGLQNIKMC